MCRNIHTLYHTDPPATQEEIHLAALQYVRKVSGYRKPSRANEEAFMTAVNEIATASARLLASLQASPSTRSRKPVQAKPGG